MRRIAITIFLIMTTLSGAAIAAPLQFRQEGPAWVYTTRGDFQDVRADLVDAIESRGLVVSYQAYTGSMLQRTAGAVGAFKRVY